MSLRKGRPISKQGINHHNKCHIYSRNYKYSNEFTSPHGSSSASNIWRKLWVAVTILYNQNTTISYLYELNKNGGQAPVDEDTIMAPPDKSTLYNIAILHTFIHRGRCAMDIIGERVMKAIAAIIALLIIAFVL